MANSAAPGVPIAVATNSAGVPATTPVAAAATTSAGTISIVPGSAATSASGAGSAPPSLSPTNSAGLPPESASLGTAVVQVVPGAASPAIEAPLAAPPAWPTILATLLAALLAQLLAHWATSSRDRRKERNDVFDQIVEGALDAGAALEQMSIELVDTGAVAPTTRAQFTAGFHSFQASLVSYRARFGTADELLAAANQLAEPLAEVQKKERMRTDPAKEAERLEVLKNWLEVNLAGVGETMLEANSAPKGLGRIRSALRL